MVQLKDQVALVTGASAGIGEAIVIDLVKNGMIVIGTARRLERLKELERKLKNSPGKFVGVKCDVTIEDEILSVFKLIKDKFGRLDVLVNNAGLVRKSSLSDGDTKEWLTILNTNVIGLSICSREAVRLMKATNIDGYIININSVAGHTVAGSWGQWVNMYPASKHAVTALTQTLRIELMAQKSKIRLTSISPGCVETEIMAANGITPPSVPDASLHVAKLYANDIAETVTFLLTRPQNVEIREVTIQPQGESF